MSVTESDPKSDASFGSLIVLPSLKLTFSHLKTMDGWNVGMLVSFLGWPIFRGELLVSGSVTF